MISTVNSTDIPKQHELIFSVIQILKYYFYELWASEDSSVSL